MMRHLLVLSCMVGPVAAAVAQTPAASAAPAVAPRFHWQPGATLRYRVVQQTVVHETTVDDKTEKATTSTTQSRLALVRQWKVQEVDKQGIATLEMSITEMKSEFRQPDGSVTTADSTQPADAKAMANYLNTPIVVLRIDSQGKIVDVKQAKGGNAARIYAELPFRVEWPEKWPQTGGTWERRFTFKLDPPLGTGESYEFLQKYTEKGTTSEGLFTAGLETTLKNPPPTPGEQLPLLPLLWTGEVYFNTRTGQYQAARLKVQAELMHHQGEGTKYRYESVYAEDLLDK
ncbi:MAG: hypothetical protein RMJ56_17410 [Gemmataceae bacterium]|nr:hypothetical protein [Gemmata sp.]MDW8199375.1 hypothetical protein [Gemmataceae bacterium]